MGGLNVTPDTSYDALDPAGIDALVIPGGLSWEKGTAVDLGGLVHRFRDRDRLVAGICAAASALGGTGVLNDVAHTGNSLASHKAYAVYSGEALYRDQPKAVSDRGIITAAGSAGQFRCGNPETPRPLWSGSRGGTSGFCGGASLRHSRLGCLRSLYSPSFRP